MSNQKKTPQEQMLLLSKIQTGLTVGILVIIMAFTVFLGLQVREVVGIAEQIDPQRINATVSSLKDAADTLAEVDINALNDGIGELTEVAGDLSELDVEKLNGFIESLEKMGKQMDSVTNVLKSIFGGGR